MPLEIAYYPIKLPPPSPGAATLAAETASILAPVTEPRPRDFAGRIRRRDMVSLRRALDRPMRMRQRIAGVIALGLLPALLAMTGWGEPNGIAGAAAQDRPAAAAHANTAWDRMLATIHSDAAPAPVATPPVDAARPLVLRGTALDRARALQCLTTAIYYEAAREPDDGQRAVAQVVLNRVAHPAFPKTVCGVVYQGSERPGCQFSFACDGSMAHAPMAQWWERARRVAEAALGGYVFTPVSLATHYHTSAVHPAWSDSMALVQTIGAHQFYRWTGSAGTPHAFAAVYAGGEPVAAPHPRTWVSNGADFADPLSLEKAFEAGRMQALRAQAATDPAAAPGPGLTNPAAPSAAFGQIPLPNPAPEPAAPGPLPQSGTLRPDAQGTLDGATHWIKQPGA